MDRDAFAARDVADDLFAANRVATPRAEPHEIVEALDLDLLLACPEYALDGRGDRPFGRLLVQVIGRYELHQHLFRRDLAVADRREEIVQFLGAEIGERLRERVAL